MLDIMETMPEAMETQRAIGPLGEITIKKEPEDAGDDNDQAIPDLSNQGSSFHVDSKSIASIPLQDQSEELKLLGLDVYNQSEFEEGVLKQVDEAFKKEEEHIKQQIAQRDLKNVQDEIRATKQRIKQLENALAVAPVTSNFTKDIKRKVDALNREKDNKERQLKKLLARQRSLTSLFSGSSSTENQEFLEDDDGEESSSTDPFALTDIFKTSSETKQEEMIRLGHMTPFGTVINKNKIQKAPAIKLCTGMTDFDKYLLDQAELRNNSKKRKQNEGTISKAESPKSTKNNKNLHDGAGSSKWRDIQPLTPPKKSKTYKKEKLGTVTEGTVEARNLKRKNVWVEEQTIDLDDFQKRLSDSDYLPSSGEEHDDQGDLLKSKRKKTSKKSSDKEQKCRSPRSKKLVDDGNQTDYLKRVREWHRERLIEKQKRIIEGKGVDESSDNDNEYEELEGGYKIPLKIWNKLYKYQQTCVQWLWELHCQRCGGIIGDEMGLGKTIQVIAFLVGLWNSKLLTRGDIFRGLGPIIIVTPTTIMHQWVKEFHMWWPPIRIAILHESGSYTGTKESLIRHITEACGVLVTSYSGLVTFQNELIKYDWHYIILDEGHKIRNPDAQATLACKQFRTSHRLILSGSPLQNNLKELWSLFDFIFPGKLGTLPIFMQQFSVPITLGGYANATEVQIQTAYKCATVLRDTISPYLLRRMKADVKMSLELPNKNEQVLFCRLTDEQRQCYKEYLDSDQLKSILDGRLKVFLGLIHLRKICNHPDLYDGGPKHFGEFDESSLTEEQRFGFWKRAGKMIVIEAILKLWYKQKHRVLFFSQSRQMLNILEYFVKTREYSYLKMDGTTSISSRQPLINKFNSDPSIFIFLLTTRVGGLGVNLTGANRVIIYDPDWNPSTDLQARERAWRIGQRKDVTIYRLLTSGTIEEKIYHRQIFKQFLTNRVLKDPRQRRFFKNSDLYELFTLQDQGAQGPETVAIFAGTGSEIKAESLKNKMKASESKIKAASPNKIKVKQEPKDNKSVIANGELISLKTEKHLPKTQLENGYTSHTHSKENMLSIFDKNVTHDKNNDKFEKHDVQDIKDDINDSSSNSALESAAALKLAKMKELAKKLSQQLVQKYNNNEIRDAGHPDVSSKTEHSDVCNKSQKQNKKKSKIKKHKKLALFEGEKIDNLVYQGTYNTNDETQSGDQQSAKQDDYVLQKLFAKSGIQSALRHDVIMEDADPDFALVEKEAERVAKQAVQAMKRSRRSCYEADLGIPNWTGSQQTRPNVAPKLRFGQKKNSNLVNLQESSSLPAPKINAQISDSNRISESSEIGPAINKSVFSGEPVPGSSGIMSSSQLLANLRARNHSESESDNEDSPVSVNTVTPKESQYDELLVDLRNFIAFQSSVNGQATTQEILEAFRDKLPAKNSAVFKALLHKICDFQRNPAGQGMWFLKGEFR